MTAILPPRFLLRVAHPCRYVKGLPHEDGDSLLDLAEVCRIDNFAGTEDLRNFADVRLAWNEAGIALQVEVTGKEQPPQSNAARLRSSDGIGFWLDTRDSRT